MDWLKWRFKLAKSFFGRELPLCQQASPGICQILEDCLCLYHWLRSISEKENTFSWVSAWVSRAFPDWKDLNSEWFLSPSTACSPGCESTFVSHSGAALAAPGSKTRSAFTCSRVCISKPMPFVIHAAQVAWSIHTAHKHNKKQLETENQKAPLSLLFRRGSGPGRLSFPRSDLCAGSWTTLILHMAYKMSKHKNGYWWSAILPLKCSWIHCVSPVKCQKCEGAATVSHSLCDE